MAVAGGKMRKAWLWMAMCTLVVLATPGAAQDPVEVFDAAQ